MTPSNRTASLCSVGCLSQSEHGAIPFPSPSTPETITTSWKHLWQSVSTALQQRDYAPATIALYRTVLRNFYRHAAIHPATIDTAITHNYIHTLVKQEFSWSWIGTNISVLRNVFDRIHGTDITRRLVTPKRPQHLPEILSPAEARAILAGATTTRDQLLLGLMYGCGLKVGEVRQLRWQDFNVQRSTLRINYNRRSKQRITPAQRNLPIPPDLLPVLITGKTRCPPTDYLFQGRKEGTHLSTRTIELILRKAVQAAETPKPVTCMTLRHSFAVHCLEHGDSIRTLQEALGHDSVKTTLLYESCSLPPGVTSPLDMLRQQQACPNLVGEPSEQQVGRGVPSEPSTVEQQVGRGVPSEPSTFEQQVGQTIPGTCPGPIREPPPHNNFVTNDYAIHDSVRLPLFKQPLSVESLELPFRNEHPPSLATRFYTLLKTQIAGRFLATRRAQAPPG